MSRRSVGVTILPEFFQAEGVEAVLDNVTRRAGATAIATSPYVMRPAADGDGSREPPIDAGAGSVRLLDRPLWGRRELWVRTAPSFEPRRSLYEGLRYQPAEPDALTDKEGKAVEEAVRSAKARGLEVHMQVQAAIPPGYRVQFGGPVEEDRPLLPNLTSPRVRVDNNGSLASPHILAYTQALIRDVIAAYPDIDVLRIDWPEYPPYSLDALFFDFSPHAMRAMEGLGYDAERIRRDAADLYESLAGLSPGDAGRALAAGPYALGRLLAARPALLDWVRAKAAIVTRFVGACAATAAEASGGRVRLMPQAFPPPWTLLSGFDYAAVAGTGVTAIGVKLYTMHWPMILRSVCDSLVARSPALDRDDRLATDVAGLLGMLDAGQAFGTRADVRYPEPDEPHPVGAQAQAAKIRLAQSEAGRVPVHAFAHGYGPLADVTERMRVAFEASGGLLWINRYGYLADDKLDAIGRVTGGH
ncbi:hypothetical protein [Alsobacter sp. R-9]